MKVLAVTPTFFPELGGLEQVVLELALRAPAHGVQMDVAQVAAGLSSRIDDVQGVRVHRVPLHGNRMLGFAPKLRALARNYDLLHVHDPQLLAITANIRCLCGSVPAVLSTHGGFWHTQRGYLMKRTYEATLLRGSARHYRRVLASSVGDMDYFSHYVPSIALCANGVHVQRFNAVIRNARAGMHRWIYWGRLARNKRVDLVIDYAAQARRAGMPVDLLICGQDFDHLMPELTAQVQRLQLEDAVRFEPYLDDAALLEELGGRGVYMTASEHEGFGLSIVEAMAAGLIVVCRDMTPLNAFFEHGRAGWFQRFDGSVEDLARLDRLLHIAPAEAQAMSSAARRAAADYDWEVVTPRFVQHYREVLSDAATPAVVCG
jgi:alpha-1,3-mannosyltransferase